MLLDDFLLTFDWRTTIVSQVLVSCTSIDTTVLLDISLVSSELDPKGTLAEAAHAWVFVIKLGGLRKNSFVFTNISLMMLLAYTSKVSHASTKMEFMWSGNILIVPYFIIH